MGLLYALESIRTPVLDKIMSVITLLGGELFFMVIAVTVFWCVSKREGYYLMIVGFFGTVINQFLKILCCVPRPRIKDPEFNIVESARAEAPRLSLGQAAGAPGGAVVLPLVLASGDALPVGSLSLRVQVEPAAAAESVTFRRAGDWARRKAAFEARPQGDGGFSWILSLSEPAAASTDTLVGEVVVRLARGLSPGTQVTLLLDPAVSGFGDAAGTRFVSPGSGGLLLADGTVDVVTRIEPAERR